MAEFRLRDYGDTWISFEITGLSHSAASYGDFPIEGFRILLDGRYHYWDDKNNFTTTTRKTIYYLTPGETYLARAYAYWDGSWVSIYPSLTVQTEQPSLGHLDTPVLYSISSEEFSITVNYYSVPNAHTYEIQIDSTYNPTYTVATPYITFTHLWQDSLYSVRARAIAPNYENSAWSSWVSIWTKQAPRLPTPILKDYYASTTSIFVTYSLPTYPTMYIGYLIYLQHPSGETSQYPSDTGGGTFHGLQSGAKYKVRAYAVAGEYAPSYYSSWQEISTLSSTRLAIPQLESISSTDTSITATYKPVTNGVYYTITYDEQEGPPTASLSRSRTFSGLDPETLYYVSCKVSGSGFEDSEWSVWSPISTKGTHLLPPEGIIQNLSLTTPTRVYFSWNPVFGATGYNIYQDNVYQKGVSTTSTYLDFTGSAGIKISTTKAGSESPASAIATIMWSRPGEPIFDDHIDGTNSVTMLWHKVTNASFYWCYYKKKSSTAWIFAATAYGLSYNFTGIETDIPYNYRIKAVIQTSAGNLDSTGLDMTYTLEGTLTTPTGLIQNNSLTTTTKVYFYWNAVSGATGYNIYKDNAYIGSTSGTSYSVAGDLFVHIKISATTSGVESPATENITMVTRPPSPVYSSHNIKAEEVTINWVRPEYTYYAAYYKRHVDPNFILAKNSISDSTYTFTGLTANTKYNFMIEAIRNTSAGQLRSDSALERTYTTLVGWTWTSEEIFAFTNKGAIHVLTYSRWNEFVEAVETTREDYNSKHGTSLPTALTYKMTSSDRVLTAARFNGIRSIIGSMKATQIEAVSPGDPVMGWYFIRLSDRLNEVN